MYYVVKSRPLATYLIERGFELERVEPSRENYHFVVFLFIDNRKLREAITEYTEMRNRNKEQHEKKQL